VLQDKVGWIWSCPLLLIITAESSSRVREGVIQTLSSGIYIQDLVVGYNPFV
jgi:hypothetical protein